ncbi:unnamed protein product, partial [Choristocarpus tenellus]
MLGRRAQMPPRGLLKPPPRLVYSLSMVIPPNQRHNRVVLGFTSDGEYLAVCCGSLSNPSYLELRRIGLEWKGLTDPQQVPWTICLRRPVSRRRQNR